MFASTCKAKPGLLVALAQPANRSKAGLPLHQNQPFGTALPGVQAGEKNSVGPKLSIAIHNRPPLPCTGVWSLFVLSYTLAIRIALLASPKPRVALS